MARRLALALALAGTAVGVLFAAVQASCGSMVVSEDDPVARCAPNLHPLGPMLVLGGIVTTAAVWWDRPAYAIGAGVGATALGMLFGFSAGMWGIVAGVLMLLAGAVALRIGQPAPAPP